jgi:hypothetical protein
MNTQQNQNEIKKKGVQVNPSRDVNYEEKEKDFSGEFETQDEDVEASGEDVNPSELDKSEVEYGQEQKQARPSEPGKPGKPQDTQKEMSSDLGGDISQISNQGKSYPANKDQKGNDLH